MKNTVVFANQVPDGNSRPLYYLDDASYLQPFTTTVSSTAKRFYAWLQQTSASEEFNLSRTNTKVQSNVSRLYFGVFRVVSN